jgi:DDE family transposase
MAPPPAQPHNEPGRTEAEGAGTSPGGPPDRNAQFVHLHQSVTAALVEHQPVISVDTKKKELVGDFKNTGREWHPQAEPEEVRVYDFLITNLGRAGRIATVVLRAGPVSLKRPRHGFATTDPETVPMTLVEAREITPPANEDPLHWRLLTSIAVGDAAGACDIVRLYRLRWRIEDVFRALKSDGMRLEETQVHEAGRLFKLAVVGLAAACRTVQLVDARDGSPRPATDVIDPGLLAVAEAIGPTLEGKTERQKNHHPLHSLAWLSWMIARLGGWNCYYKPPGPKTMRAGWAQFATMATGFAIGATLNAKSNARIP